MFDRFLPRASALSVFSVLCLSSSACVPPPIQAGESGQREAEQQPSGDQQQSLDDQRPAAPNPFVPGVRGDEALQATLDAVLASKGPDYAPRTEHLGEAGRPTYTNRLIHETSPYLLQHAHNPVNWFPWGDEVFARAQAENKPILLSIGYSTCHWCHVMERESFEDPKLAAYLNSHYLAIKVDREQRPDLDEVYMRAVQMLSGSGGWPMTVILTPQREPFFGGTYFPPTDRGKRPGFRTILEKMEQAYREQPDAVVGRARKISEAIAARSKSPASAKLPGVELIAQTAASLANSYDATDGGFGEAPKFPRPVTLELLLRYARRSGDEQALAQVRGTVDGIISGGIRDHIGGGFHRYSTDATWLVPHFEKMLYDNAQLVVVLLELYQITGEARYAAVARETLDYLDKEMSAEGGGFYSATDADSLNPLNGESEEGWFFTWTEAELAATLEPELAAAVEAAYATSKAGNFEHRNIFHTPRDFTLVAAELGLELSELEARLAEAKPLLYAKRLERPPPLRDDKVLSAWNGLAITAFARAAWVLDEPRYLERALACANFLRTTHFDAERRLLRSSLAGAPGGRGYLDDLAFVIQAYLDLFEVSAELSWLEQALALQAQLDGHYLDRQDGGYFTTADDAEQLLTRNKPSYDGAEPSGNSIAVLNLLRLHHWTLDEPFEERAIDLLESLASTAAHNPLAVPMLLSGLDFLDDQVMQVFVVARPDQAIPAELLAPLRTHFLPNSVRVVLSEERVPIVQGLVPALGLKLPLGGRATAYVCEDNVCQKPTSDPKILAEQLARVEPYAASK